MFIRDFRVVSCILNIPRAEWSLVNSGSGNGLVLSGKKILSEPMLPKFCAKSNEFNVFWIYTTWAQLTANNTMIIWNVLSAFLCPSKSWKDEKDIENNDIDIHKNNASHSLASTRPWGQNNLSRGQDFLTLQTVWE